MNVTAGLGAAGFGLVDDRIGSKRSVLIALVCMIVLGAGLLLTDSVTWFWVLAMAIGLFMGPAQAASRTLMAQMAPEGEMRVAFRAVRAVGADHRLPRAGGAGRGDDGDRQPGAGDGDGAGVPGAGRGDPGDRAAGARLT